MSLSKKVAATFLFLVLVCGEVVAASKSNPNPKPSKQPSKTASVDEEDFGNNGGYDINPMFGYTHVQQSPYTLPAGTLILGTSVSYGVLDFFQVGTNVLRDFYKVYNADVKLSMIKFESFALALTGGWEHYNYKDLHPLNPAGTVTSLHPGVVTAYGLGDRLALFLGGNLQYTKDSLLADLEKSGYAQGARAGADLSWAYNPPKGRGVGNVLSIGATYDITYKMIGYGMSHHFPGFHLGIHYFPSAARQKYLPIISGGMVM